MPMHLTQIISPTFATSSLPFDAEIRQLGNVHQAIPSREDLDESAEFFHGNDASVISLADLDLAAHATDNFLRTCHALAARRVDVHGAVVLDVNLSSGFGDNAFNRFAAGPDERSNLLRIDFYCLNARRIFA